MIPTLEQPFYVSPKTSERLPVTDVRIHQGLGAHAHFIGSVDCPVLQPGHFTSVHACFMWFEVFARPGRISFLFRLFERPAVVTATVFVCSTLSLSQLEWPFHPLVSVWEQLTRSRLQRARSCKSTCATFGIHIFTACCCISSAVESPILRQASISQFRRSLEACHSCACRAGVRADVGVHHHDVCPFVTSLASKPHSCHQRADQLHKHQWWRR